MREKPKTNKILKGKDLKKIIHNNETKKKTETPEKNVSAPKKLREEEKDSIFQDKIKEIRDNKGNPDYAVSNEEVIEARKKADEEIAVLEKMK